MTGPMTIPSAPSAASGRRLEGRTALVTGAAGGIGQAVCLRMALEGARLYVTDRDEGSVAGLVSRLSLRGVDASGCAGDVTDAGAVASLVAAASAHLGGIDILVNCAGYVHEAPVHQMTIETWDLVLTSNLTSVFLMCREVVPGMTSVGYGRIINFASQLGLSGASEHSAYSAAKAGIIGFTKSLAREVSPLGVTANCIAPGPVDTPMLKREGSGWTKERVSRLPIPRIGEPREVAGTVVLLASEIDGAMYTGQTIGPNCGDVMP